MKTLIISDTHLSHGFNQKKFDYVSSLIKSVDFVIINGDFWDHHQTTFEKFIDSRWNELFPLLKARNCIYIKGNHDENVPEEALELFCKEIVSEYRVSVGNKILYITHGQEVVRYLNKIHIIVDKVNFLHKPVGWIVKTLIFITNKKYLKVSYQKMNNTMKEWAKNNLQPNEILVCGHSHLQEVDIQHQFIDLGGNTDGLRQYAIVDENTLTLYSNDKKIYSHQY